MCPLIWRRKTLQEEEDEEVAVGIDSPDMELLQRRMKQFLGLHYNENTIESGVDRLRPWNDQVYEEGFNKTQLKETISRSRNREELRERWNESPSASRRHGSFQ